MVSITVIGLYIAYVIPVYLRWRMGDAFEPGPWTLGSKYRWVNPAAIIWVAICVVIFILPFVPEGVPWNDEFTWSAFNYAPVTVGVVLLAVGAWWLLGARNTSPGRSARSRSTKPAGWWGSDRSRRASVSSGRLTGAGGP